MDKPNASSSASKAARFVGFWSASLSSSIVFSWSHVPRASSIVSSFLPLRCSSSSSSSSSIDDRRRSSMPSKVSSKSASIGNPRSDNSSSLCYGFHGGGGRVALKTKRKVHSVFGAWLIALASLLVMMETKIQTTYFPYILSLKFFFFWTTKIILVKSRK